jgi:hypothetical protein
MSKINKIQLTVKHGGWRDTKVTRNEEEIIIPKWVQTGSQFWNLPTSALEMKPSHTTMNQGGFHWSAKTAFSGSKKQLAICNVVDLVCSVGGTASYELPIIAETPTEIGWTTNTWSVVFHKEASNG